MKLIVTVVYGYSDDTRMAAREERWERPVDWRHVPRVGDYVELLDVWGNQGVVKNVFFDIHGEVEIWLDPLYLGLPDDQADWGQQAPEDGWVAV